MESIKAFLTLGEALRFCEHHPAWEALFVQRELDGRYHVYNGGDEFDGPYDVYEESRP